MRQLLIVLAGTAALLPTHASAETARVLSSIAIMEQVQVPRTVCTPQQVAVQPQKSGAGALMGAIAGGVVGNQIGKGSGKDLATAVGIMGGAILGNNIEGQPAPTTQTVQNCVQETVTQSRVKGYRVTYEYGGRTYETEYPIDPGATLQVQVTPVFPR